MKNDYLVQPDVMFGVILLSFLKSTPPPKKVVFVSAFTHWQTLMRFKAQLLTLAAGGCQIRIVLGVDMGGTSKEVLAEVATWPVEVLIIKNRYVGHTVHPKLYLIEWDERALIFAGSNNMTEGGFYHNYELTAQSAFTLPEDLASYTEACSQLARFVEPSGETTHKLDADYLAILLSRNEIPSEAEASERRRKQFARSSQASPGKSPYGAEKMPAAPPHSEEVLALLEAKSAKKKQIAKTAVKHPKAEKSEAEEIIIEAEEVVAAVDGVQLHPFSFYMQLTKMKGKNTPGEPRIPIGARDIAKDFWGWPDKYTLVMAPKSKAGAIYPEWYSEWTIRDASDDRIESIESTRLYEYPGKSEFRFYSKTLVEIEAVESDIVRITRTGENSYDCTLARQGAPEYALWLSYCTRIVRGHDRRYGYN